MVHQKTTIPYLGEAHNMNIKTFAAAGALTILAAFQSFATTVDSYNFTMRLQVPRIYDNMQSKGYRKYQPQTIVGTLFLIYSDDGETIVKIKDLKNRTHKVNGKMVTYECHDWPYEDNGILVVAVGSNKTLKFNHGGVSFSFVADPSYNIGEVDEDNTLMLELSGHGLLRGDVIRTISGSVRGNIGCGCMSYGHVSPTRRFFGGVTDVVVDVAPLHGTFTARFKGRQVGPIDVDSL